MDGLDYHPKGTRPLETLERVRQVGVVSDHLLYRKLTSFQVSRYGIFDDADLFKRMEAHLTRLGLRVPTDAELRARLLARRRRTLSRRVELLRRVRECEAHPSGERPDWANPVRCIRFLSADLDGLDSVTGEEREAARGELAERVCLLAETGRISATKMTALRSFLN